MSLEEALAILTSVCAQTQADLATHQKIQAALQVVRQELGLDSLPADQRTA